MSTKSEQRDWAEHPVTAEVFSAFKERVQVLSETLVENAGLEPATDRYYAGYIAAYNDIIRMEFTDTEEDPQ